MRMLGRLKYKLTHLSIKGDARPHRRRRRGRTNHVQPEGSYVRQEEGPGVTTPDLGSYVCFVFIIARLMFFINIFKHYILIIFSPLPNSSKTLPTSLPTQLHILCHFLCSASQKQTTKRNKNKKTVRRKNVTTKQN